MKSGILSNSTAFVVAMVLLISNHVFSQNNLFNDSLSTQKHFNIEIFGNITAKSNTFPNSFYTNFYKGGYLNDAIKQTAAKELKNSNRFGGDADFGLIYKHRVDTIFKQTGWTYTFKVAERRHINLEMTKDFFNVGFFGNAMYENQTAKLADFKLDFLSYQQIGLGVEKTFHVKDKVHQIGFSANFLNGRNAHHALINKANLYTATDGEYLDLEISGKYNRTDSIKNNQLMPNPSKGLGFSFDAYYQLITKEQHQLQISMIDFGYLYWKNSAIAYNYDTLFRFEGINIPNLISINDSLIQRSSDSLINLGKRNSNKSFKTLLPSWLIVNYIHNLVPGQFTINFSGRYRFNDVYLPFLALGGTYIYKQNTSASLSIGYGGYGNFNYGILLQQRVGKYFTLGVGSNQLEGWLLPQKANGQSVVFSIKNWF